MFLPPVLYLRRPLGGWRYSGQCLFLVLSAPAKFWVGLPEFERLYFLYNLIFLVKLCETFHVRFGWKDEVEGEASVKSAKRNDFRM